PRAANRRRRRRRGARPSAGAAPCCRPSCRGRASRSASGSSPDELHCLAHDIDELARVAVLDVHAKGATAARLQHLEIAPRLRREAGCEAVGLARDGQVLAAVAGRLQEDAVVRAALVELSGRVQEARAVYTGAGEMGCVAHRRMQLVSMADATVVW